MPENTAVTNASKDYRPPKFTAQSTSMLPDLNAPFSELYFPWRGLGYTAAVVADMYVTSQAKKAKELGKEFNKEPVLNRFARWEAGVFASLTVGYAIRDGLDAMRNFRGALAAEQGKAPSMVGYGDMLRSQNPIIQKAVKRFGAMQAIRLAADAAFAKNLNWGLLAMAARITIERTVFNRKTAYERMELLFDNTQIHGFDIQTPGKIAREYGNIVQQTQKDHRRPPWTPEVLQHYTPLFDQMAEATVNKEILMPDAVYMLGEVMTKRLTLEESLALFGTIREHGLENIGLHRMAAQGGVREENLPEKMTTTQFAEKYMSNNLLSKDSLTRGQRSFGDMAKSGSLALHTL